MKRTQQLIIPILFIFLSLSVIDFTNTASAGNSNQLISTTIQGVSEYLPPFVPVYNVKEQMTLSPIFTPNNALDVYLYWIGQANTSIYIQNPYITKFNSNEWYNGASPIVTALVNAHNNGVSDIRVQVNKDADNDNVTAYFQNIGIPIKWMGNSASNPDNNWVSTTHNKLMIIDGKVAIISSINFSENAFMNNRESGMVIQDANVANAFDTVFQRDWVDGQVPTSSLNLAKTSGINHPAEYKTQGVTSSFVSPFDIPKVNFTGVYNVSVFTNPDNADNFIFHYLESAKQSIYVSMYTISRPDFNNTLIALKKVNPALDIQVLISRDRVGSAEDHSTIQAVKSLIANSIPVYNSTSQLNYYHNKYWIIDGKEVFVYSGNWSPASVTANSTSYASGTPNRDMGIAVHDAPDVANFFINSVWKKDVSYATAWNLVSGVKQVTFTQGDVIKGTVTIKALVTGLPDSTFYYRWNNNNFVKGAIDNNVFTGLINTSTLPNGVNTFEVKVVTNNSIEFTDNVTVTVANYPVDVNWRVLITEVLANPSSTTDALGEFYEITNSFPFNVSLDGWSTGTKDTAFDFPSGYVIPAYTSIILARDATGFNQAFAVIADFEYSFTLTNTADYVYLMNNHGSYVDVVAYGMNAPDGSETLTAAASGKSLQRSPLYVDTNTTSDFITALPTPKGDVPHVSLANTTNTTSTPFATEMLFYTVCLMGIFRLKRIKKKTH